MAGGNKAATVPEIYLLLYSGEELTMQFASRVQANTFRNMLFRNKKRNETALSAIGAMEESEKLTLSMIWSAENNLATFKLRAARAIKQYAYIIISPTSEQS